MRIALLSVIAVALGCTTTETQVSEFGLPEGSMGSVLDSREKRYMEEVERYPKRHDLYYQIAGVRFQKEDYNGAVAALDSAIDLNPNESRYHYHLGRVHLRRGDVEQAEHQFRVAADLLPEGRYTGPHAALGFVYAKQKKFDRALAEFRRCVEIEPDNPIYYYFLGSVHDIQGNRDETVRYYKQYLTRGGQTYRTKVWFLLESLGVDVDRTDAGGPPNPAEPPAGDVREDLLDTFPGEP